MPNSFNVVDWLAQESLAILTNKLAIAANFNSDYNKEFTRAFAPGETVRVPFPKRFRIRDGLGYNPQAIDSRYTTVTVDQIFGVDFEWDSVQAALELERPSMEFSKNYLKEPMETIAQEIESRAALFAYQNANNIVGALGTNPTTFDASSAAARERLVELACPVTGERSMCVTPGIMRALKASAISYFNPVTDISKQFRTGIVGSGDGFEWYESVSLYQHTAGTWQSAVTVSGAGQTGSSLLVNTTSGDTFLKGDVVSIDGVRPVNPRTRRVVGSDDKPFVITETVTASASTATISIYPAIEALTSPYQNVDALPANAAALTLFPGTASPNGKTGTNNLAFHRDAFAIVGVPLEVPTKAEMASQKRDPETGIAVRFVRMFDPIQSKMVNRFDVLLGFGQLYSDNCAVRVLGA